MNENQNNMMEKGYISVPLYEKSFGTEVSTDVTLPDYQNEIRRILHVEQTVLPPSKYVSSEGVEFSGVIDYRMLYIGADGELCGASMSGEYSFSIPLEKNTDIDISGGVSVLCGICAESVSTRVSAPRRLNVRSRIRPNVRVYGKMKIGGDELLGDIQNGVYRQERNVTCAVCEEATSDIVSVEQTLPAIDEEARIVAADAKVHIIGCEEIPAGLVCRGKLITSLIISSSDGQISTREAASPFECEVDMSLQGASICAHGNVTELNVSVTDTGVECKAGIIVTARAISEHSAEYVSDMYSDTYECTCETAKQSTRGALICANSNISIGDRVELSAQNIPESAQIMASFGSASMDRCVRNDDGKYVFSGNARVSVLWGDGTEISCSDIDIPVRYEVQGTDAEPICFDAACQLIDVRARIDASELCIDAELIMSAYCMSESSFEYVRGTTLGDKLAVRSNELVICYPDSADTLWSVAKRYAVSPARIIGDVESERYVMIE